MAAAESTATDLVTLLDRAVVAFPTSTVGLLLTPERKLTFGELRERARRLAQGLVARGTRRGEVVAVVLPNSLEFMLASWGVILAGAALAPLVPPGRHRRAGLERLERILRSAGIRRVIAMGEAATEIAGAGLDLTVHALEELEQASAGDALPSASPDDLALVQFTSGSTSSPKGVALSHRQACAGAAAIVDGARITEVDRLIGWLPMTHDMGFVGMLVCVHSGASFAISAPSAFIKAPGDWLRAFGSAGGTLYAGPSSSYQYLVDGVDAAEVGTMDLGAWRVAFNGAERIDPNVIERFSRHFAAAGFRPETMFPVYGMAEATLAVTFPEVGTRRRVEWVDRALLASEGAARLLSAGDSRARGILCVGRPLLGLELRIIADGKNVTQERTVGAIHIRGRSVTSGYYQDPERTAEALHEGWLDTGDLGYLAGGELFVTGRRKELLKYHGESYFPEDLEAWVKDLDGVYRQRCVAVVRSKGDEERLSLLVETQSDRGALAELGARARRAIGTASGLDAFDVYLVRPGSLLVTTSGKYQRLAMRKQLESGELEARVRGVF